MKFESHNIENHPENEGRKEYDIGGNNVSVAWKKFLPEKPSSPESEKKKTVFFLPGWSIAEKAGSIEKLCEEFAGYSGGQAFAIDSRAEKAVPDMTTVEAEAVRRFIEDNGPEEVVLAGNSYGGVEAIHLAACLQEKNPQIKINGLVLLDSMSLYDQKGANLAINYAKDMVKTRVSLLKPPQMKGADELADQNRKYMKDGFFGILREIMRSNINYPKRFKNQIQEMVHKNAHLEAVKAPIVIIQGAEDLLSNPKKIIPDEGLEGSPDAGYLKDMREREKFLKEHIFKSSPYIRMIVPEKMGHHNVMYSRPESVAHASLYLLERWQREKKGE